MNLVQALAKQIKFCEENTWYKCGVFVKTKEQRDIFTKCISFKVSRKHPAEHTL